MFEKEPCNNNTSLLKSIPIFDHGISSDGSKFFPSSALTNIYIKRSENGRTVSMEEGACLFPNLLCAAVKIGLSVVIHPMV
jgi:hypothetical protein